MSGTRRNASDYTVDLVYPSAFGAFQAPVHLAYAAALGGRRGPEVDRPFTYCDLGTGAGLTLCVLADCYPQGEFHGVDINPDHIRTARDIAERAGLRNVHFHEASFADLPDLRLPRFHFVALSGIYSWLTPELRHAALGWAAESLHDDGLVFLHYGALPGNAQIDSLYALIRETAREIAGDSLTKFTGAITRMHALVAANASFFRNNPYARAWLEGLPSQDQRSMAHEALNAQPSLSARDAADEAAAHGLYFVANAQIELNHMALVAPDALRPVLESAAPIAREMMLDAVRNAHSRMDVLARPGEITGFRAAAGTLLLDRIDHGPMLPERQALTRATGVDFTTSIYGAILAEIENGAIRVEALFERPLLAVYPPTDLEQAIKHLVASKLIHLLCHPYPAAPAIDAVRLVSPLNRLLLDERIESAGSLPLASRIAGTQVMLPPADRLALLALVGGDFEAAWRRVRASGQRITQEGRSVDSAAQLARVAQARATAVGPAMIDHLGRLGIVENAA